MSTPLRAGKKIPKTHKKNRDSDSDTDTTKQKSQKQKKANAPLEPVDSNTICSRLKDIVLSKDTSQEKVDEFLNSKEYKEAFVTAKAASPKMGKRRGGKGNILHHLVHGISNWTNEDLRAVLMWLFGGSDQCVNDDNDSTRASRPFHSLLRDELGNQTAMHVALDAINNKPQFVEVMLKLKPVPENLAAALCMPLKPRAARNQKPSTGHTCLHYAICQGSDYQKEIFNCMQSYFEELCQDHWHPLRIQEPNEGNTPLHLAVSMARPGRVSRLVRRIGGEPKGDFLEDSLELIELLVKSYPEALEIANHAGRTAYQERIHCLEESEEVKEAILLFKEAFARAQYPPARSPAEPYEVSRPVSRSRSSDLRLEATIRTVIASIRQSRAGSESKKSKRSPKEYAAFGRPSRDADVRKAEEARGMEEAKQANEALDEEARLVVKTVQQSIDALADQDFTTSEEFRKIVIGDPIAEYVRNYCISNMEREKVMECLYPPGEGKPRAVSPHQRVR